MDEIIGSVVNNITGTEKSTNGFFKIHYGNKGVHIVS
jgi:hypothetical protein